MTIRLFWLSTYLMIFILGCATPKKSQNIQTQQLKTQINFLEEEIRRKDEEIRRLENELSRLDTSIQRTETKDIKYLRLSAKQIQIALRNAGFYTGEIDGKIGPRTKEAIKAFQKANNLKVDGIVGKRTIEKLNRYLP